MFKYKIRDYFNSGKNVQRPVGGITTMTYQTCGQCYHLLKSKELCCVVVHAMFTAEENSLPARLTVLFYKMLNRWRYSETSCPTRVYVL